MDAEIKDARIVVEHLLRPVSMVHVPIDNEDFWQLVPLLDVPGGNGHVVQQAEPHRSVGRRMMAGRADRAKCIADFARKHGVNRGENPADRLGGHRVRRFADRRVVGVGIRVSPVDLPLELVEMRRRVNRLQPLVARRPRGDDGQFLHQPHTAEPRVDRQQPLGPLRVSGSRFMPEIDVAIDKAGFLGRLRRRGFLGRHGV